MRIVLSEYSLVFFGDKIQTSVNTKASAGVPAITRIVGKKYNTMTIPDSDETRVDSTAPYYRGAIGSKNAVPSNVCITVYSQAAVRASRCCHRSNSSCTVRVRRPFRRIPASRACRHSGELESCLALPYEECAPPNSERSLAGQQYGRARVEWIFQRAHP